MTKWTYIRFIGVGMVCALILGALTLISFREFTENSTNEFRKGAALTLAKTLEINPKEALDLQEKLHPDSRPFRSKIWIVDSAGAIIATNNRDSLPRSWTNMPKPQKEHEIDLGYRLLGLTPAFTIIRLASPEPTFLVMASAREDQIRKNNFLKILIVGLALAFSAIISMLMTFFYLRRKSKEAREILLRLEHGDLKARFQIRHFDEIGSLMLDFNRMASEIERLVGRLEQAEQARKTLFQELSHDLRTPLTSLRTSIDALALHWEQMPSLDRKEIISVSQAEISYFTELLENLLFIAQMDEPKYKKNSDAVNIVDIIDSEVRTYQATALSSNQGPKFELSIERNFKTLLSGDAHLIRRLVKNLLENARRFAKTCVTITLVEEDTMVLIQIQDDGPGMSAEDIENFGKPRQRRLLDVTNLAHVSLGLGSTIVKKILELHKGTLKIKSSKGTGTLIQIELPKD
jgi:signal transduction histidine kinase